MKVLANLLDTRNNYNSYTNNKANGYNNVYYAKPVMYDSVSFTAGLTNNAQKSVELIRATLESIEHQFSSLTPNLLSDIRKNYSKLVARKGPGLTFNVPQYGEKISIVKNNKDKKFLRITVQDDLKDDFILLDNDRLVNHTRGLKDENVEEYVGLAREELEKFSKYVKESTIDKPKNTSTIKVVKKIPVKPVQNVALKSGVANHLKAPLPVQKIMKIFASDGSMLPQNIRAVISPSNKQVIGLSTVDNNGITYSVSKGIKSAYGDDLTYLIFKKTSPDGVRSYLAVDLKSYKFLMLNNDFKPLIRNNTVYEYSADEVTKRGMDKRLETFVDVLTNGVDVEALKVQENIKPVKVVHSRVKKIYLKPAAEDKKAKADIVSKKTKAEEAARQTRNKESLQDVQIPNDKDKLIEKVKLQAREDAKQAADEYFKIFVEEFQKNVSEKISAFKEKFAVFFSKS